MDAMPHTLTSKPANPAPQEDPSTREWDLALRVIDLARGLIVSKNPFLSSAIGLLRPQPAALEAPFACDGQTLFVDAGKALAAFSREREAPVADLTHVLLHCVLLHPFVSQAVDGASWDLAADIVAELLAEDLVGPRPGERGARIAAVRKRLAGDLDGSVTTERLYRALREGAYESERRQWSALFFVDDHGPWPSSTGAPGGQGSSGDTQREGGQGMGTGGSVARTQGDGARQEAEASAQEHADADGDGQGEPTADVQTDAAGESAGGQPFPARHNSGTGGMTDAQRRKAEQAWSRAAKSMRVNLETISRTRGAGLGSLVKELEVNTHERVDYRSFLRQFAVEHEDMRLSEDEFDYVFYTYGLELYRNMPLVEPLEYRHERRIRDFAIVIDTSSSVSEKVVQEFVNTTFDVLSSEGGFFSKTNIHIIQADARVQSDAKICSLADLDRWRRNIKLHGFGGTDFRPAFAYVQQLRQRGEFDDLQGLLYFTDGWGIYPDRMPPYKCAFVFYDEDHRPELVPPWAIQVVLHPGQYESLSVY